MGEGDRLAVDSQPLGYLDVDDAESDGDPSPRFQHLRMNSVLKIFFFFIDFLF